MSLLEKIEAALEHRICFCCGELAPEEWPDVERYLCSDCTEELFQALEAAVPQHEEPFQ